MTFDAGTSTSVGISDICHWHHVLLMALHNPNSHVAPLFDHLDLKNATEPLIMLTLVPLVSYYDIMTETLVAAKI